MNFAGYLHDEFIRFNETAYLLMKTELFGPFGHYSLWYNFLSKIHMYVCISMYVCPEN